MATSKSSAPITVRLPNELILLVESEATALGMSRSEVVSRRLKRTFSPADEVRKTDKGSRFTDSTDTFTSPEEETE